MELAAAARAVVRAVLSNVIRLQVRRVIDFGGDLGVWSPRMGCINFIIRGCPILNRLA